MLRIAFKKGYKYQLEGEFTLRTPIIPARGIATDYIQLAPDGTLMLARSYAWDGPSGVEDVSGGMWCDCGATF